MTMFSRNDKAPEAAPAPKPAAATPAPIAAAATPTPPPPPPTPTENRRFQMPTTSTSSSPSVSVISKALKITGQLESTEDIHIEGEVEGDVRGVSVKVGQSAKINGSVHGEEVEVSGTVNGKIEARKVVPAVLLLPGPDEVRTANDANAKLGWGATITSVNFRVKGDIITLVRNGKKLKERPR